MKEEGNKGGVGLGTISVGREISTEFLWSISATLPSSFAVPWTGFKLVFVASDNHSADLLRLFVASELLRWEPRCFLRAFVAFKVIGCSLDKVTARSSLFGLLPEIGSFRPNEIPVTSFGESSFLEFSSFTVKEKTEERARRRRANRRTGGFSFVAISGTGSPG